MDIQETADLLRKRQLNAPVDVVKGPDGALYIADRDNHRILEKSRRTESFALLLEQE